MTDESFDSLERQIADSRPQAPAALRVQVLAAVDRQLASSRWDRRLAQLAAVLLVTGVGLNVAVDWHHASATFGSSQIAGDATIVDVGVAAAQATDVETGGRIARHLAMLRGADLSAAQWTALEKEIERRVKSENLNRKEG